MPYIPQIDGLRAIAVLAVIAYHAGAVFFSGGFVGVDIFFVISGFLITSILLTDIENKSFSIAKFYERRIRRILPPLFLVMLTCLPLVWIWLTPGDMKDFSKSLISTSLFISNILFWKQSGYFDTTNELKPLIHTWSLAVEEQFYIFFPILLLLLSRYSKRFTVTVSVLVSTLIASLIYAQWGVYHAPEYTFYMLTTRAWEILLGAITAIYLSGKPNPNHHPLLKEFGSLAGLLLIIYTITSYKIEYPFPGLYALPPTIGTVLIIVCGTRETYIGKLLSSAPLVWVGLLSYSVYLWHQPIFAFSRITSEKAPSTGLMWLLTLLSFGLAYLSWRYVEQPFRHKENFTQKQVFLYGMLGSLFFIAVGFIGQNAYRLTAYRGMSDRQINALNTAMESPKRSECHTGGENYLPPHQACEYFGKNIKVAVFGDSHAVELAYALASELKSSHIGVKHFSFSGCRPAYQSKNSNTDCARWTAETMNYLKQNTAITTVVLSYRLNQYLFGRHEASYPTLPNMISEEDRMDVWTSYTQLLQDLRASGKEVIAVLQAPEVRKRPEDLIFKAYPIDREIISVPTEWWHHRNAFVTERARTISKEIRLVDPATLFCDSYNCYLTNNGQSLYFDDDHMSVAGATLLAQHIIKGNFLGVSAKK